MTGLPAESPPQARALPDYLPARMVNEFVYCPRLFFYEWVEGVFLDSADTLEGKAQHKRVDQEGNSLCGPEQLEGARLQARSILLSSEQHRVIARMDLLEVADGHVCPVDYKHGRPRETAEGLEVWPTDRVQLAVQALILRENGYRCQEGYVYYLTTKQRVRVGFSDEVMEEAGRAIAEAWKLAQSRELPPPLVASPKCLGCSLAPICLPDEVALLRQGSALPGAHQLSLFDGDDSAPRKPAASETRLLMTPRDDLKPVYLNTQGLRVGRSHSVLEVKDGQSVVMEIRPNEINQLNVMGNVQLTTQAIQLLCEQDTPVCYFSQGGWFYGITQPLSTKNVFLRQRQFRLADEPWFCLRLARQLVAGKIRNQRTLLMRNHAQPDDRLLRGLKELAERSEGAASMEELLGLEGQAGRLYFGSFNGLIKVEPEEGIDPMFRLDLSSRNRRPPRDPVNALLSLAYSLLVKDLTIACYAAGFDPMMGFYHQPRFGRPSLALDLMEPFRPLVADSAVLQAINNAW
jgi:CRISPR-associated protein Cas1